MKYQIRVPSSGWRRDKIDDGRGWQGNLSAPTVSVDQRVGNDELSVTLVDRDGVVEVDHAEIAAWVEADGFQGGGYWGPSRLVPQAAIELVVGD